MECKADIAWDVARRSGGPCKPHQEDLAASEHPRFSQGCGVILSHGGECSGFSKESHWEEMSLETIMKWLQSSRWKWQGLNLVSAVWVEWGGPILETDWIWIGWGRSGVKDNSTSVWSTWEESGAFHWDEKWRRGKCGPKGEKKWLVWFQSLRVPLPYI